MFFLADFWRTHLRLNPSHLYQVLLFLVLWADLRLCSFKIPNNVFSNINKILSFLDQAKNSFVLSTCSSLVCHIPGAIFFSFIPTRQQTLFSAKNRWIFMQTQNWILVGSGQLYDGATWAADQIIGRNRSFSFDKSETSWAALIISNWNNGKQILK